MNRIASAAIAVIAIIATCSIGTAVAFSSSVENGTNENGVLYMVDVIADDGQTYNGNVYIYTDGDGTITIQKSDGTALQFLCAETNVAEMPATTLEIFVENSDEPLTPVEATMGEDNVLTPVGGTDAGLDGKLVTKVVFTATDGNNTWKSTFYPNGN